MNCFYRVIILFIISGIFIGCNSIEQCCVPVDSGNNIASHLKIMPIEDQDISNPTGNERLSQDIKEQMPLLKL